MLLFAAVYGVWCVVFRCWWGSDSALKHTRSSAEWRREDELTATALIVLLCMKALQGKTPVSQLR